MKAAMLAFDQIKAGTNHIMVAGGMESMSNAPYLVPKVRTGLRMGHGELQDAMFTDGLEDAKTGRLMGSFAQDVADQFQVTREDMDDYAIKSLQKALAAIETDALVDEIVPVEISTRAGKVVISIDEQPGKANLDKIKTLKPAFKNRWHRDRRELQLDFRWCVGLGLSQSDAVTSNGLTPLAKS